jgi:hypothetical protein
MKDVGGSAGSNGVISARRGEQRKINQRLAAVKEISWQAAWPGENGVYQWRRQSEIGNNGEAWLAAISW